MRQGTSAGDITNKRNCRTIFADYVRQRQAAQLGLRSPTRIQAFVNPALAYQTTIEGAAYTTLDEFNSYVDEVSTGPVITVPGAPTGVTGTPGNQQVEVSFVAPTSDGGSAITSYTVTASPGGATATGAESPLTVSGLINGTSYTFSVVATNSIGDSLPSESSAPVTPSTVPSAPSILFASPGDGQATIFFDQPSDGGSAITNYEYSINNGGSYIAFSPAQTSSPVTITGLANGTTYQIRLKAVNVNGVSAQSLNISVTPAGVPPAPTEISGVSGDGAAYILFTQTSNGGSAITNYAYSLDGSNWTNFSPSQTQSPVIITGLINGTPYGIIIRAINASGDGIASSPISVTPSVRTLVGSPLITLDANAYSGSGTTWSNLVGSPPGTLDATLINTPTYDTTDPSNTFFTFNGTNQIAQIEAAPAINPTIGSAITILMWARINTGTATFGDGLIGKQFSNPSFDGYSLSLDPANSRLYLKMNGISVDGTYFSGSNAYNSNWSFYTAVVRFGGGSANPSYIYVNPYRVAAGINNESGIPSNNAPLQFPRGIQETGANFCPADIGAIYYYNTVLSQADIIANYDATKSRYSSN